MYSIGLMSGTSMDGIDASILELTADGFLTREVAHIFLPYEMASQHLLKAFEYSIRTHKGILINVENNISTDIREYFKTHLKCDDADKRLDQYAKALGLPGVSLEAITTHSTLLHIQAVYLLLKKAALRTKDITIIGYHGQTVYHNPSQKKTISLANATLLSNTVNIPVIHNFRENDVKAGGKGAPFAPLYHYALALKEGLTPVGIVNCGGIANVTLVPNADSTHILAYDTGPANALLDTVVRLKTNGQMDYDKDGTFALKGKCDKGVLAKLFEKAVISDGKNFFNQSPPKALDTGDMQLIPEVLALSLEDACATLATFTGQSIVDQLKWALKKGMTTLPTRWILAGGGWKHPLIRLSFEEALKSLSPSSNIHETQDFNWNADALEANIFAYLAVQSLLEKPLSLPNTTGVPYPLTGGVLYKPSIKIAA